MPWYFCRILLPFCHWNARSNFAFVKQHEMCNKSTVFKLLVW